MLRGSEGKQKLPEPYIVLVDINLPRMGGMEFLREIRNDEKLRSSAVFILTTSARDEDKAKAHALNVCGYFLKENVAALTKLLAIYGTINEFPGTRLKTGL